MTAGTARLLRMRELREQGWSLAAIGREFGVSAARVSQLLGPDGRYAKRRGVSTCEHPV